MKHADIQVARALGKRYFPGSRLCGAGRWWLLVALLAATAAAQVGAVFDVITVKGIDYHDVKIVGVSSSTLTIRHRGGIAQLPMRDLSPDLQASLGYDPGAAAAEERRIAEETARRAAEGQRRVETPAAAPRRTPAGDTPVERALAAFGQPAQLQPGIDLRPQYRALELITKDQGRRPSCSVFAVVSAFEFQNAQVTGQAEKLSEDYLIWATRRTLGLASGEKRRNAAEAEDEEDRDAGFALPEVLAALRAYGIPPYPDFPNTYGTGMEKIPDPDETVIAGARSRRQVFTHRVPGRDADGRIVNLVHALNNGVPVVIGLRWPHWRTLRSPLLAQQTPLEGASHAVTLVGYYTESGRVEDVRFIFKNSWGTRWGAAGYGFAEIGYLRAHLLDAYILEVRPSGR